VSVEGGDESHFAYNNHNCLKKSNKTELFQNLEKASLTAGFSDVNNGS
jgi:hypothetical protein